jgi:lipoyl(octanoyl) transferase
MLSKDQASGAGSPVAPVLHGGPSGTGNQDASSLFEPWARPETTPTAPNASERSSRGLEIRDLGRMEYAEAFALQQQLVEQRKRGEIPDQFLFVEHPHVVTMGRSAREENVLASPELLERAGIAYHKTDRGGDVTYHGPGQIVGYPIVDLREWKRDVVAYVRGLEQVLIDALAEFGIAGTREPGATGVWTFGGSPDRREETAREANAGAYPAKIAAIGVHISRWVTSHGFALNVDTDLSYFRYIVPCGLTKPVTSMRVLGSTAERPEVIAALARSFARVFGYGMGECALNPGVRVASGSAHQHGNPRHEGVEKS